MAFDMNMDLRFHNLSRKNMTFDEIMHHMISFIKKDPLARYNFIIGTDSQAFSNHTKFVTGIVLQREMKGAWACYTLHVEPRKIRSVKEKLNIETACSERIAYLFKDGKLQILEDTILPYVYKGVTFNTYIDIDAGTDIVRNKTAPYVKEMMLRVESLGMTPRVKPDACIASGYADKQSKKSTKSLVANK